MKDLNTIESPTKIQLFILRIMVIIGLFGILFFFYTLFRRSVIDNPTLYFLLMTTFIFTCFKVVYEWYHYWSITVPSTPPQTKNFTVDIFTTFCAGEPYAMIVETLTAIQSITYPHTTYLCDEANDPYLKSLCEQLNIHHITRAEKIDAKAGNINNALKISKGELCVVLDPDHVPAPEFLDPIVSHFENEEIGFVQIVQAYSNHGSGWIAKGAAQQTYQFYGPMMMTMNAYGTVQAIGANCTFRRSALESIGYHAAGLAEDMHTAMRMHARGWKSIYVPAVLTQGLVPATLSAYYKQQLKWSRGVFELLVTSYVELFKKFSWRQKLHYGLIPFFYLSGFIFLINFILPVISLMGGIYPLHMNFNTFFYVSLPFVVSVVLIRHYVQRWVMKENEHGFHVVGGFLLIGTWWVFILGIFYTLIRKKVPYIPTPKDTSEENNFLINLPNLIVFVISLIAIGYGLYNDLNPYNLVMAGMASINCGFMMFTFLASQQFNFREYQKSHPILKKIVGQVGQAKTRFWFFRRRVYSGIRSIAIFLVLSSIGLSIYEIDYHPPQKNLKLSFKRPLFLSGIFEPSGYNGLSSMKRVNNYESSYKIQFNLISYYISWGDQPQCFVPTKLLDSVYKNSSIPLITWEPWENLFRGDQIKISGQGNVCSRIAEGVYDAYIIKFASQLKSLNKPVFLRFAHEADNPFYPWSESGGNKPEDFKAAFQHVHKIFEEARIHNVIWVWNPWKAYNAEKYFPGKDFVDWVGITGLNFGSYNDDGKSYSFKQIYSSFHSLPLMKYQLPVIIAEMGSLKQNENKDKWFSEAIKSIHTEFKEIKGIVLFNSEFDKNIPGNAEGFLNWQITNPEILKTLFSGSRPQALANYKEFNKGTYSSNLNIQENLNTIKGTNYTTRQNWEENLYPFTKKVIERDFSEISQTGLNTIKITGPSIYDRSTFSVAQKKHLQVVYSFWMPDAEEMIKDRSCLNRLENKILWTVRINKNNPNITAWNFGNNTFQQLSLLFDKPQLNNEQQKFIHWMGDLIRSIRKIDQKHLITVDALTDATISQTLLNLHDQIPEIDAFGIEVNEIAIDSAYLQKFKVPYFFSFIKAGTFLKMKPTEKGAFIGQWQDQRTAKSITFNGLNDLWGHHKPELYQISKYWNGQITGKDIPNLKILQPAFTTVTGAILPYHVLVYQQNQWKMANAFPSGMHYEWYLAPTNDWVNPLSMNYLGSGADINLSIPKDPSYYRLFVIGIKDSDAVIASSSLNLPL